MYLLAAAILAATPVDVTLDTHFIHQFDSSLDGGGDVAVDRLGGQLRLDAEVTSEDSFLLRFGFEHDAWDFTGTGLGTLDPWSDVETVDIAFQWTHQTDDRTQFFGGPVVRWSGESGVSASDSVVVGGMIGLAHSINKDLTLGAGVGVLGQLEDSDRFYPIIVVNWNITDQLRLTSDITTRFGSRTGGELVWTPRKDWSLGVGLAYEYNRFRLDGDGFASGGVGEATSWPLFFRATWHPSDSVDVSLLTGLSLGGHVKAIAAGGAPLQGADYDPAGGIGLVARFHF